MAESQLAPTQNDEDESRPETKAALCEQAVSHAGEIAVEYFPALLVEAIYWETSTRMQRSFLKTQPPLGPALSTSDTKTL